MASWRIPSTRRVVSHPRRSWRSWPSRGTRRTAPLGAASVPRPLYFAPRPDASPAVSFIPSDLPCALEGHGAASGAVGGDAVALTAFVAPHRPPVLDAS